MKKAAIFLLIPFFISGCIKEEMGSTSLFSEFTFQVQNAEGHDLLNPNTEGHLSFDYINFYHVIEGKEVFQYVKDEYGTRKGISIVHNINTGEYDLTVSFDILGRKNGEISTSILKMHGYPADTLKAEVFNRRGEGGVSWSYSRVWINGEEFDLSSEETAILVK